MNDSGTSADAAAGRGFLRPMGGAELRPVDMPGAEGVRMAVMVGREHGAPNFSMRQFEVRPGGHTPRHSHDYEHEVIVLSGTGTVLLEGEVVPVRGGDALFVAADSEHQFRATGAEPLRFACFVPANRNCGDPTPGS